MASRVFEAGTIVSRVLALIRTGVLTEQPLWLAVAEVFPPPQPTQFNRTALPGKVPQLVYQEDQLREDFSKTKTVMPKDVWSLFGKSSGSTVQERYVEQQALWMKQGKSKEDADACTLTALKNQSVNIKTTKVGPEAVPATQSDSLMRIVSSARSLLEERRDA